MTHVYFRAFMYSGLALAAISLSGCAMVAAYPVTAASVGTTVATGKSPTDHAVSESAGKDCSMMRVFEGKPVCEKRLRPDEVPVEDLTRQKKLVPTR
jgi:hypothetical protein